jgi:photosystem II stability/assembly factor-like uncharacterized protein
MKAKRQVFCLGYFPAAFIALMAGAAIAQTNFWAPTNGPSADDVRALLISSRGEVFAGTNGGVFRSTNEGNTWTPLNAGLTNSLVQALAINATGDIFAGTVGSGVFRLNNNDNQWQKLNTGMADTVFALAFDPSTRSIFAGTGNRGVLRSTDNGNSWTLTSAGLLDKDVRALAINDSGHVFAGTLFPVIGLGALGRVFRSTDNGNSWKQVLLTENIVNALAINFAGDIFAGTAGFVADKRAVFRSMDNGNIWKPLQNGLLNNNIFSLAINKSGVVFAGTRPNGAFLLPSNDTTWTTVNTGLTNKNVQTLAVSPANGRIFAGTLGGGVFRGEAIRIAHTPLALGQSGREISVQATVTAVFNIASTQLNYRRGGDPSFTSIVMSNSGSSYQGTIPVSAVISCGVEYFIVATDQKGLTARLPASGYFSMQVQVPNEVKPMAQPNGNAQTAYRLFSVPLDLDNKSAKAVLEDDLDQYDDTRWRFSELLANQTYAEISDATTMIPGKAFWLLVKDAGKIIDTGAGKSNVTSRRYAIHMHPAWNFVANPFNFPIPAKNISLKSGKPVDLRTYTGSWNDPNTNPVSTFVPFEGYAVFNELSSVDTLLVNPDLSASSTSFSKQAASRTESYLWAIRILAQCQEARDVDNAAAIIAGASKNFDASDRPEPPVIGEYVSVSFPHRDWAPPTPSYCIDARPEFARGEIWEFEVTTNIRDKVHLTFDGLEQVPNQFAIWVVDEALNVSQNLREKNQYAVVGTNQSKRLKLVVGRQDFVSEQLGKVNVIPAAYELSQNFPNPFNPATAIRFGLPQAERVTLKVYNLLGEEVVTPINNEPKEAGYHVVIWDGRNQAGRPVASGMYIYRLHAGSVVMTKKMAFVQ